MLGVCRRCGRWHSSQMRKPLARSLQRWQAAGLDCEWPHSASSPLFCSRTWRWCRCSWSPGTGVQEDPAPRPTAPLQPGVRGTHSLPAAPPVTGSRGAEGTAEAFCHLLLEKEGTGANRGGVLVWSSTGLPHAALAPRTLLATPVHRAVPFVASTARRMLGFRSLLPEPRSVATGSEQQNCSSRMFASTFLHDQLKSFRGALWSGWVSNSLLSEGTGHTTLKACWGLEAAPKWDDAASSSRSAPKRQRLCLALSRCWECLWNWMSFLGAWSVPTLVAGKVCVFSTPSRRPSCSLTSPASRPSWSAHMLEYKAQWTQKSLRTVVSAVGCGDGKQKYSVLGTRGSVRISQDKFHWFIHCSLLQQPYIRLNAQESELDPALGVLSPVRCWDASQGTGTSSRGCEWSAEGAGQQGHWRLSYDTGKVFKEVSELGGQCGNRNLLIVGTPS